MDVRVRAVTAGTANSIERTAANSVFWELPRNADNSEACCEDPAFDKQLWIQRVLMEWGICGYTAFVHGSGDLASPTAAATTFFAPPSYLPGSAEMPSGSVSADAVLLSTVYVAPAFNGLYLEHQLIDTVLTETSRRGAKAVEAYGWVGADEPTAPLMSGEILLASGFHVVQQHPHIPRYRKENAGTRSVFARFAEADHDAVNQARPLRTVLGGAKPRKVGVR